MFIIPMESGVDIPPQVLRIVLDGTPYQLYLRWNERGQFWRVNINDDLGNALAAGLCVRNAGNPINGAVWLRDNLPHGLLFAEASGDLGVDANNAELGSRVQVVYATTDDLIAAGFGGG